MCFYRYEYITKPTVIVVMYIYICTIKLVGALANVLNCSLTCFRGGVGEELANGAPRSPGATAYEHGGHEG